ncbi:MAG: type II toxin-antitoxin system antitoxin SocA domain-containing protein [Pyrinomonadaceae bacterium]
MIVKHHKEKAYNAITYFLDHTILCNKKKIYKLLFLLDFEHFNQTGRNVTGYDYFAWKMGPVPTQLHEAIGSRDDELLEYFDIVEEEGSKHGFDATSLSHKQPFESKYFSKREFALLESLVERFDMMSGGDMERFTHRKHTPWYRVWVEEGKRQEKIPYEYALDGLAEADKETILDISHERKEFLEKYQ